ncbi:hypothetical protein Si102_00210 [Streptococcus infantarius subsp. infantarius]|nr:hypothetical protein [Streptococcus infantarius subsp. infantarius]MCO4530920.1 hypothetical protein [Streptococcus infantarius subsp. infantarius]MCO4534491.1 hypothetical protein [Streptococcus infantarius subsp. infantarius]MCO4536458.1 hypothetical protein [Streptococcus infantarius subsp. infantarius]
MDKKQVHKIGKKINKPIKFVKQNKGTIAYVVSVVATIITAVKTGKKK